MTVESVIKNSTEDLILTANHYDSILKSFGMRRTTAQCFRRLVRICRHDVAQFIETEMTVWIRVQRQEMGRH